MYRTKWVKTLTKDFLIQEYVINKKCMLEIAKEVGCCETTVYRALDEFKIGIPDEVNKKRRKLNTRIKKIFTKQYLIEEYIVKDRTSSSIAKEHHTSHSIVLKYLNEYNIKIRTHSLSMLKGATCGSKHWNWHGGKNRYGYSNYFKKIRHLIHKRDCFICQFCGRTEKECLDIYKCVLDVHHIDYDKNNDSFDNLISLCKGCHTSTHKGREDWKIYFKDKILRRM